MKTTLTLCLLAVSLLFSTKVLAAASQSIWILQDENTGERSFNSWGLDSHLMDSIDFKNYTPETVTLRYRRSTETKWTDLAVIPTFQKKKIVFGAVQPDFTQYSGCTPLPSTCTWIQTKVGELFEFQDPTFKRAQPIPFIARIYIFLDGGGEPTDY